MKNIINRLISLNGKNYSDAQLERYCRKQLSAPGTPQWEADICSFILEFTNDNESITVHTSGSTADGRPITLMKKHMVQSALNTSDALDLKYGDNALLCIPANYIAGKMMIVRAMIIGMDLITMEPASNPFTHLYADIDFAAMVPMQIGMILQDSASTSRLKEIHKLIIGGGKLDQQLTRQLSLFPNAIFETYGMTETSSHIALKKINGDDAEQYFKAMPGVEISKDERGCLVIGAPSISANKTRTNDMVRIVDDQRFEIIGRYDNVINSGGVKLNPEIIENKLASVIDSEFFIASLPDDILGEKVILVIRESVPNELNRADLYKLMKAKLAPFELPKEVHSCVKFYYTETTKISRKRSLDELKKTITFF